MKVCAYCEKTGKLTREHVIPDWHIKENSDGMFFSEIRPDKLAGKDIIIKDVCAKCNSGVLSQLDSYGKGLYKNFFSKTVYSGSSIDFEYDYNQLARWLLKIIYNSARVHGISNKYMKEYVGQILGQDEMHPDLMIFCSTIAPSVEGSDGSFMPASILTDSDFLTLNKKFAVGAFKVEGFDGPEWLLKHVNIDTFQFSLCLPVSSKALYKNKLATLMRKSGKFGVLLSCSNKASIPSSLMHTADLALQHAFSNPLTYQLYDDEVTMSAKESQLIIVEISKKEVVSGNIGMFDALYAKINSREASLIYMQKVQFCVSGYDDDVRALHQIPEFREYIKKVDSKYPYWFFVLSAQDEMKWVEVLLSSLCVSDVNYNELDVDRIDATLKKWFLSLNEFCNKHFIQEEVLELSSPQF